ncbi:MAG TPA: lipocalin family protein [Cyclobacteriaceae bacterium]|jgi:hypothetical protein|nr:lipocalin family protein [Cyclobacteriaceae bacterium]
MKIKFTYVSVFSITIAAIAAISCSDDKTKSPSKEELLAGSTSVNWKLTYSSEDKDEADVSCTASSAMSLDNVYTFKKGGAFQFDNGTIIDGGDCDECCSDIVNSTGIWKIYSNNDSVSVYLNAMIDGGVSTPTDEEELFKAKIISLTKTELKITQDLDTVIFKSL